VREYFAGYQGDDTDRRVTEAVEAALAGH
jgi:hypothetical protein